MTWLIEERMKRSIDVVNGNEGKKLVQPPTSKCMRFKEE
jgi:hypothetical protein